MAQEKGTYDTFDSGAGPTIVDKGDYASNDANPSDQGVTQGAVPTTPQSK